MNKRVFCPNCHNKWGSPDILAEFDSLSITVRRWGTVSTRIVTNDFYIECGKCGSAGVIVNRGEGMTHGTATVN